MQIDGDMRYTDNASMIRKNFDHNLHGEILWYTGGKRYHNDVTIQVKKQLSKFKSPHEAIDAMVDRLKPVGLQSVALDDAVGRVITECLTDRPSPPSDVSAMDGYAVRLSDLTHEELPIVDSLLPGQPALLMPATGVVRVMTGAIVPSGAQAVIKREEVEESNDVIRLRAGMKVNAGQHIRRRGENAKAGVHAVEPGMQITAGDVLSLSAFGAARVQVYQKVRVAIVVTGDELVDVDEQVEDWQIRDSNGPALRALWTHCAWVDVVSVVRVKDECKSLEYVTRDALAECDALLMTGGVSMGTHDFVPEVLRAAGCELVFHKLPQRPGGPLLGAIGPRGQAVFGLPGNPQSALISARRIAMPALRIQSGLKFPFEKCRLLTLTESDGRSLDLWWYRLVRHIGSDSAELIESRGSGDMVAVGHSDGLIEVPPGETGAGPWEYYPWMIT